MINKFKLLNINSEILDSIENIVDQLDNLKESKAKNTIEKNISKLIDKNKEINLMLLDEFKDTPV